jgi:hypothetical protein
MEAIFEKMLKQAVSNLDQLEKRGLLEFKVVCGSDEYGTLVVAKKPVAKKKRASPIGLKHGEMRDFVVPLIENVMPGEIVSIPFQGFPPEIVRGNACAWATIHWGKKTYTSTINRKNNQIEIYRYPKDPQDFILDLTQDSKHDPI